MLWYQLLFGLAFLTLNKEMNAGILLAQQKCVHLAFTMHLEGGGGIAGLRRSNNRVGGIDANLIWELYLNLMTEVIIDHYREE